MVYYNFLQSGGFGYMVYYNFFAKRCFGRFTAASVVYLSDSAIVVGLTAANMLKMFP